MPNARRDRIVGSTDRDLAWLDATCRGQYAATFYANVRFAENDATVP